MKIKGFKIKVNGQDYEVHCRSYMKTTNLKDEDTSLRIQLDIQVFEDNKIVYPYKGSYLAEVIERHIKSLINIEELENKKDE